MQAGERRKERFMISIVNLTPHAVNVVDGDGNVVNTFPPSGSVSRCAQTTKVVGDVNGIPVTASQFGAVMDLPEPSPDARYIVSRLVLSAACGRQDLLVPNELVRDGEGNIVGCKSFAIN